MKAEHRRELETNALADHLGRLVDRVKTNPAANTRIAWAIGGIAVVVALIWYFAHGSSTRSDAWVTLDTAQGDVKSLETIAQNNRGSMAARTARFQMARTLLQRGLRQLYSPERTKAADDLQEARRLFQELEPGCKNEPLLEQEALMGQAKAEEALVSIPKEGGSGTLGDLDRATQLYRQLAQTYPDSYLGQQAARHLTDLEAKDQQVAKFYSELDKLNEPKKK